MIKVTTEHLIIALTTLTVLVVLSYFNGYIAGASEVNNRLMEQWDIANSYE